MTDENSANVPLTLPRVLQEELEKFQLESKPAAWPKNAEPTPPAGEPMTDGERAKKELDAIHERIAREQPERSALCLSGGGIRSATFALGVVQVLAKAKLLTRFDYLSTVSGGGYLGSMLTAWIHARGGDAEGVAADLASTCPPGQVTPEIAPLQHLRRFSNYIAPKLGLFSADGWTLVATALRNLLLNWTVLVLILAGFLVLPWLGLLGVLAKPTIGQLDALLAVAFLCIAATTAYPGLDLPGARGRGKKAADPKTADGACRDEKTSADDDPKPSPGWRQKWFILGWLAPLLAAMLCLAAWWAGRVNYYHEKTPAVPLSALTGQSFLDAGPSCYAPVPADASAGTDADYYDEDAAVWLASEVGKLSIGLFLIAASVTGVVACGVISVVRDWRCGRLGLCPEGGQMLQTMGISLASIFVLGLPGAALLWALGDGFLPRPLRMPSFTSPSRRRFCSSDFSF